MLLGSQHWEAKGLIFGQGISSGYAPWQNTSHAPLLISISHQGSVVWAHEEETQPLQLRWVGLFCLDARDVDDGSEKR